LLRPHELYLEGHAKELAELIMRRGHLLKPLVVEASNMVLLDGAHRLRALKMLGAYLAPVAIVNYDSVGLKGWVRLYAYGPEALADLRQVAEVLEVKERPGGALLIRLGGGDQAYYDLLSFERRGNELKGVITLSSLARLHHRALAVIPPPPSKDLVLRAALTGRLLPPRSTRHITEAKRLVYKIPLSSLMGSPVTT